MEVEDEEGTEYLVNDEGEEGVNYLVNDGG